MRRVAAHRLHYPGHGEMKMTVVEIEDDYVVNYYPIGEELPMTEWLGGDLFLSPEEVDTSSVSWDNLCETLRLDAPMSYPLYCYYWDRGKLIKLVDEEE